MQFQELKVKKFLSLNLNPQTKMKSDIETQGPLGICVITSLFQVPKLKVYENNSVNMREYSTKTTHHEIGIQEPTRKEWSDTKNALKLPQIT